MTVVLRGITDSDATAVLDICRQGIATGNATFDPDPPDWEHIDAGRRTDPG